MKNVCETYLSDIRKTQVASSSVVSRDNEHPHRPALKKLLEAILPDVEALNDPGKIDFGAPDFALIKAGFPIGYVEAKRIGEDLDVIAQGEQLKRYLGYANLILTNYLEFRFYKHGEEYCDPITVADPETLTIDTNASILLESTVKAFFEDAAEPVRKASRLAEIMGENGKRLRGNLVRFLKTDNDKNKPILEIYEAFRSQLIHDLSLEDFADMYAQTLVYGLFVARYHDKTLEDFSRQEARDLIPNTNPLLRRFFDHIAGSDFDTRLEPIVDELCKVFSTADVRELMKQLYKQDLWGVEQASPDPVIHFYEDFLKNYDAEQRKKLGAYYTPPSVVHFIVRSIDEILKNSFGLDDGLADVKKVTVTREVQGRRAKVEEHKVQVLDPAVGTGTFLNETIRLIRRSFVGQEGSFSSYVKEHLLPRLHGFELMMAPYTIAHLKLAATLRESGAENLSERIGVYLTNSLEPGETNEDTLFGPGFGRIISEESHSAARIKNDTQIMVVLGNPPYAGESSNKGYSDHDVYKVEPGTIQKLRERNSKWINDDYVKFIRLAESFIEKTGEGIVGMITAHGYIDNPTFRGMRYHLMQTFSEIYVLDLHGNANKKEKTPEGGKDENVFSIMQGVSIFIGVRRKGKRSKSLAKVYKADCYGLKKIKLECLNETALGTTEWEQVFPSAPNYEWVIRDERVREEYNAGFSISDLFRVSSVGIATSRDAFVISTKKEILSKRIQSFLASATPQEALSKYELKENLKWKAADALRHQFDEGNIVSLNYRPFDTRYVYYHDDFIERGRKNVMRHYLKGDNLGLLTTKGVRDDRYQHLFVTESISEVIFLSGTTASNAINIPLYLYTEDGARVPNLDQGVMKQIVSRLNAEVSPENIFDYIYAVLHSPTYRRKYNEFLKIGFPRVPYPTNIEEFKKLIQLGKELRELHLLESPQVRQLITTYPERGEHEINTLELRNNKVFINETQYFDGVSREVWEFYVGGYQPAQKWLKDRKNRKLSSDDITHYQQLVVALNETIRIMKEIDRVIES